MNAICNFLHIIVSSCKYFLIIYFCLFSSSCNLDIAAFFGGESDTACDKPVIDTGGKNSELAILMRKMKDQTWLLRQEISSGGLQSEFPGEFEKIYTAVPTDSAVRGVLFNAHSTLYVNALKEVYSAPDTLVKHQYNRMIHTCINCHKRFCPGPVKLIKKMTI